MSAPRATKRFMPTSGAACLTRNFCTLLDPEAGRRCAIDSTTRPTTRRSRLARSARLGEETRSAGGHSHRDRRIRRSLRRDRLRRARRHAGQSHRHVDLRLRRRLRREECARYPGHLRHRQRRDPARILRHRGRPVCRRRYFQMVGRSRVRRRWRAPRATDAKTPRNKSPARAGLLALDWNNGNRTILVDPLLTGAAPRPDAAHDPGGNLSRTDRGHGVRRPRHHRAHPGIRRADRSRGLRRRHRGEKSVADADLRRRHRLHDARGRLESRPAPSVPPSPPPCSQAPSRRSRKLRRR